MKKDLLYFQKEFHKDIYVLSKMSEYFFDLETTEGDEIIKAINERFGINSVNQRIIDLNLFLTKNEIKNLYDLEIKKIIPACNTIILNFKGKEINGVSNTLNSWAWEMDILGYSETITNIIPNQKKKNTNDNCIKSYFNDFENLEAFLIDLTNSFNKEKGQTIRVIIDYLALKNILKNNISDLKLSRNFSIFYEELKKLFKRDIGTKQSIEKANNVSKEIELSIIKELEKIILRNNIKV